MFKYIILGIVQGLTEFFPVSSSGHLLVIQKLLGVSGNEIAVSVVLHLGTSLAIVAFFFKDILKLLRDKKSLFLVILVVIITGTIGVLGKDFFESLFSQPRMVAYSFMFTAIVLFLTKFAVNKKDNVSFKDALILGFTQAVAIVPGISRSGITISTLLFRGVNPKASFNFSFMVALPIILGATLLEARKIGSAMQADFSVLIVGFIFSFLSGLLALFLLKKILIKAKFHYFGYYCIVAAILTLLFVK